MRLLATLFAISLALSVTACSPSWWQDFKNNPTQATDAVLDTAQSAADVAAVTFHQLKGYLPPEQQDAAQAKFDKASVTLSLAIQAVRDAVRAAAEAKNDHPDLFAALQAVGSAVSDVQALVVSIRDLASASRPGTAPGVAQTPIEVPAMAALDQLAASVKAQTTLVQSSAQPAAQ